MPTGQDTACHVQAGTLTPGVTVQIILLDSQDHVLLSRRALTQLPATRLMAIHVVQTPNTSLGDTLYGPAGPVRFLIAAADVHVMCVLFVL